jgi:hypothetical protein
MRYKLRTLLILLAVGPLIVGAFSIDFLTLPLKDSDTTQAARMLVAWIVEGDRLPGAGGYPAAEIRGKRNDSL